MANIKNCDLKFNCDQKTLANEEYYLVNTFTDTIREKELNYQRAYLLKAIENGKDTKYSSEYIEQALMQSPDYLEFIKKMKQAIQTARNMRKSWLKNKDDYEDFKHDKELIGLKYSSIRGRVNFIQISVIIASTIITFFETVKEKIGITNNISMVITPIILSTYIGLALSISRFFKLDDRKEELCKLDETIAFCMGGLRHRMRDIDKMKPLTAELSLDSIMQCDQVLNDQNKDGLEETINACKQKLDLAINLSEKVKYKNMLLKINLNKYITEDNRNNLKKNKDNMSLYTYKSEVCCLWRYLCCYFNICKDEFIDVERAYADSESFESDKLNNYGGRKNKNKNMKIKNHDPIEVKTPESDGSIDFNNKSFSNDYVGLASQMNINKRPSIVIADFKENKDSVNELEIVDYDNEENNIELNNFKNKDDDNNDCWL
jgi:hypothetical protein